MASALMALSLVMAGCAPEATTTTPATPSAPTTPTTPTAPATPTIPTAPVGKEAVKPSLETPKYGGTLNLVLSADVTRHDPIDGSTSGATINMVYENLWTGDWTKGPAGGYGTSETRWANNTIDIWEHKRGAIAESTTWTTDPQKNEGTIVYKIRQGIHWAVNPAPWAEASRTVNGRELTADDVVAHLKRATTGTTTYIYLGTPELRVAKITKTGPWKVTVSLPLDAMVSGIARFGDSTQIVAPEVVAKYGNASNWKNSVGTGAFMIADYVSGSLITLVRNPNYWDKDPIGPGKGNQLPYLGRIQYIILPDASTRLAALRTAKIDLMAGVQSEDADQIRKTTPSLKELELGTGSGIDGAAMRVDIPPFDDIRVRRAMLMAIDFKAISDSVFGGKGWILAYPWDYAKEYSDLYIELDDPEMPESTRELYTYNPEKAKQLLKEAGYPNGLKTTALITSASVDEFAIYKDMWAKVGIEVTIDIRETAAVNNIRTAGQHPPLGARDRVPPATFFRPAVFDESPTSNPSRIKDPVLNEMLVKLRLTAVTESYSAAVKEAKQLTKYVLGQAFQVPGEIGPSYTMWWPWLRNYSGEQSVGYYDAIWPQWVWYDEALKKSIGY
ncbi:MAG: ABC transporter substrate-binding protein [Chloroflexi bacterium]|nr:ABC transporter substrate-binding protein [Chloroflexota bacterium]